MERGVPVRSICRSIAVLQCINRAGEIAIMDISRLTELPYPTVFRIIQTLMHEGLIECEPLRKRYRATCKVESLAAGYREDGPLLAAAGDSLVDLTRRHNWPVTLSSAVGTSIVVRACTHDISPLIFSHYYRGDVFPLLECAPGHVQLAFTDEASREGLLRALETQYRHSVALDMFRSGRMTRRIREDGYAAVDRTTHTKDPGKTSSISVPVPLAAGKLAHLSINFFATSLSVPEAVQRYLSSLLDAVATIVGRLETPATPEAAALQGRHGQAPRTAATLPSNLGVSINTARHAGLPAAGDRFIAA